MMEMRADGIDTHTSARSRSMELILTSRPGVPGGNRKELIVANRPRNNSIDSLISDFICGK